MSCAEFIATTMAVRTAVHTQHLQSRSYAQHVALDEFYSGIVDLIDEYAEVYGGTLALNADFPIPRRSPPTGSPTGILEEYLGAIREEFSEPREAESLKNILAEIEALTLRTLYKLRRLK